jgi:hypothetical protein
VRPGTRSWMSPRVSHRAPVHPSAIGIARTARQCRAGLDVPSAPNRQRVDIPLVSATAFPSGTSPRPASSSPSTAPAMRTPAPCATRVQHACSLSCGTQDSSGARAPHAPRVPCAAFSPFASVGAVLPVCVRSGIVQLAAARKIWARSTQTTTSCRMPAPTAGRLASTVLRVPARAFAPSAHVLEGYVTSQALVARATGGHLLRFTHTQTGHGCCTSRRRLLVPFLRLDAATRERKRALSLDTSRLHRGATLRRDEESARREG